MEMIISYAAIVLGIWIAIEIQIYIISMILAAFKGDPPSPNAPAPEAQRDALPRVPTRPLKPAYQPVAVRLYRRLANPA